MPKKPFTISKWKGLYSESDPRDVEPGTLQKATDVFIDKPGKIRLARVALAYNGGGTSDNVSYALTTPYRGYGLFQFSADYNMAGTAANTDYLLVQDGVAGDNTSYMRIAQNYNGTDFDSSDYDGSTHIGNCWYSKDQGATDGTALSIGTVASSVKPVYYYVDGALRVCDGNFGHTTSANRWFGYIKRTHFEDGNNADYDGWYIRNQAISAPTECTLTAVFVNQFSVSSVTDGTGFAIGWASEAGESNLVEGNYDIATTFIYDGNQESKIKEAAGWIPLDTGDYLYFGIAAFGSYNPRITDANVYIRMRGNTDWVLVARVDMKDGVRSASEHSGMPWIAVGADGNETYDSTGGNLEEQYLTVGELSSITYEMSSGISIDEDTISAKYKTACIINRRCYIGNVRVDGVNYGDRMIKSPVNKFDTFPASSFVDVAINDGDEIIALVALSDKIFQFKKKNLYIINVTDDYEYIEDTYQNKGIVEPCQVCKVSNGIAWCNKIGVYMYDGQQIHELSTPIKDDYQTFFSETTAIPAIGYDELQKKLVILGSIYLKSGSPTYSSGDTYVFDVTNGAWTLSKTMYTAVDNTDCFTNFINDVDGKMLIVRFESTATATGTLYELNTADKGTSELEVTTSDMAIGDISLRKRFYGVRITYKATGTVVTDANVKLLYGVNGIYPARVISSSSLKCTGATPLWTTVELLLSAPTNFYSLAIKVYSDAPCAPGFEINDISIIYRETGVR